MCENPKPAGFQLQLSCDSAPPCFKPESRRLWQSEPLFPSKCYQRWFPNTARISPVRKEAATKFLLLNFLPLYQQGTGKELICLVQAKDGAVFGNPILFGTRPLLYLTSRVCSAEVPQSTLLPCSSRRG